MQTLFFTPLLHRLSITPQVSSQPKNQGSQNNLRHHFVPSHSAWAPLAHLAHKGMAQVAFGFKMPVPEREWYLVKRSPQDEAGTHYCPVSSVRYAAPKMTGAPGLDVRWPFLQVCDYYQDVDGLTANLADTDATPLAKTSQVAKVLGYFTDDSLYMREGGHGVAGEGSLKALCGMAEIRQFYNGVRTLEGKHVVLSPSERNVDVIAGQVKTVTRYEPSISSRLPTLEDMQTLQQHYQRLYQRFSSAKPDSETPQIQIPTIEALKDRCYAVVEVDGVHLSVIENGKPGQPPPEPQVKSLWGRPTFSAWVEQLDNTTMARQVLRFKDIWYFEKPAVEPPLTRQSGDPSNLYRYPKAFFRYSFIEPPEAVSVPMAEPQPLGWVESLLNPNL